VATAADGLEAMTLLTTRTFEVVIADLNMRGSTGGGSCAWCGRLRTHETPMALFSAQDNYRESLRLLTRGPRPTSQDAAPLRARGSGARAV